MSVSPVTQNSTTDDSYSAVNQVSAADDLLSNFMTLLVAQMQNQDPTNPMDNNQLTSQLAQFQTAAGIEKLNSTVAMNTGVVFSMHQNNAVNWIGRTVLVEGDTVVTITEDGNPELAFSINSDVEKVKVTFTDDQGNAYVGEIQDVKKGINTYTMDGVTNFQPAEPEGGPFTVTYSATTASGDAPDIVGLKSAEVESVDIKSGVAVLHLNGLNGTVMLGEIYQVQ